MSSSLHHTLWHGADYNPEQWLETPQVWEDDLRLMNAAHMSSATIGIFSWTMLEPREGEFDFSWMERVFETLAQNGQKIVLATPSGAKPHWMARQYPEIRRVVPERGRQAQQARHNHCPTSPVYRAKVAQINGELARRFGKHEALLAWHLSNEYSGECGCDLCFGAFRDWLRKRYDNDLDKLNRLYWSRFWSHSYSDWDEIDFIDKGVHALGLDWRRFMTHQTTDFMLHELAALRPHSKAPATTNMMGDFTGLDYAAMAPHLDFISWDAYPQWGKGGTGDDDIQTACWSAFHHDFFRALKRQPFWLMECSPGQTNWRDVSKLKAPGVHRLSAWQTVAHGGDAVMYFQWRQSRGSSEKFHAAVVSHEGSEKTRMFGEIAQLGAELEALGEVAGSQTEAPIALVYDFENLWAIANEQGPRNTNKSTQKTALDFYAPLWKGGYGVDVVDSTVDFSSYKLVVAPMLYMLKPQVAERLTEFVRAGGTLVTTYWSGLADEHDLCFLGGFPGPLREVLGLWVEETDTLHAHQTNRIQVGDSQLGLGGEFEARDYCDLVHPESARVLATYACDFYAGRAALTVNDFGAGQAYYVASRNESSFQSEFLTALVHKLELKPAIEADLPTGVVAQKRVRQGREWVWVLNFCGQTQSWTTREEGFEKFEKGEWHALQSGQQHTLPSSGVAILRRSK
ncbi:MAG: beta-galactosidase [Armatimonadetes bacterium]|nr:beta-galactosidase [Armatimonadota bacterium]